MTRFRVAAAALVALAVAGFALAQNAGPNTAGPTRNDYRLRVVQPAEGAKIVGSAIEVVVDTEIPAERDTKIDVNSMPRPDVDVFIDELYQGTMRDETNVVSLKNVAYGPHTLVLLAKNRSGEVIDRREIRVITVAPAPPPVAAAPAPKPAPVPAYQPPPPEPVTAPVPAPVEKLPATASSYPMLGLAGLVLLAVAFSIRRLR